MPTLPYEVIHEKLQQLFLANGCRPADAQLMATICTDNSCAGVDSHGLHWAPGFIHGIRSGSVDVSASAECESSLGAIERWHGHRAPGLVNATAATDRAIDLARTHGIGAVALRETNHWARPGWYGLRAAAAGFGLICWTNTIRNLPAWGSKQATLGNNPIVIALPGEPPVCCDIAMSQFSYGRMAMYASKQEPLPVPGGYDKAGELSHDASAIFDGGSVLPIGHWKGAALSFALDVLVAAMSGGRCADDISKLGGDCGVSQAFIAFAVDGGFAAETVAKAAWPLHEEGNRYPGEGADATYKERRAAGLPVPDDLWQELQQLATDA